MRIEDRRLRIEAGTNSKAQSVRNNQPQIHADWETAKRMALSAKRNKITDY